MLLVVVRPSNWRGETLYMITIMAVRTVRHDGVWSLSSLPLSPPSHSLHISSYQPSVMAGTRLPRYCCFYHRQLSSSDTFVTE